MQQGWGLTRAGDELGSGEARGAAGGGRARGREELSGAVGLGAPRGGRREEEEVAL